MSDVQYWLAKLDRYGNPTLVDGAHKRRAGANRAMAILKGAGFVKTNERYAVARVELLPVADSAAPTGEAE